MQGCGREWEGLPTMDADEMNCPACGAGRVFGGGKGPGFAKPVEEEAVVVKHGGRAWAFPPGDRKWPWAMEGDEF